MILKFGEENKGRCSRRMRDGYGVGVWKAIKIV